MPYYRYPSVATPLHDRWLWLLVPVAGLALLLLTPLAELPLAESLLYPLLGIALYFGLLLVVTVFPFLLVIGFLWLVVRLTSSPRPRVVKKRPRPVPYLVWEPWEILLGMVAVVLALLYYGSVDGGRWLVRRWQKQPAPVCFQLVGYSASPSQARSKQPGQ